MLDRIRRLLERSRRQRIATPRRFLLESLEDRLNFSSSTTTLMDFSLTVAIHDRMDDATLLEASRVSVTVDTGGSWRPSEIGSPSSVVDNRSSASSSLAARRDVETVLRANRTGGFEQGSYRPPSLGASRLPVSVIYSQPVFSPPPPPSFIEFVSVVIVSIPARQSIGFQVPRANAVNVVDRPLALNLSQYDAPALSWNDDAVEKQQPAISSSLEMSRHDLALASLQADVTPFPAAPAATIGSVSRPSELSIDRETATFYGDEGGLIEIGRGSQRDRSLIDNAIKPELKKGDQAAAEIARKELNTNLTKPSEDATANRDETPRFAPRTDSLLERALAENSEGGLIDLSEVSTAGEILADTPEVVAAADKSRAPTVESTEPIEVDRSIGLFRAFELAIAPEGAIDEAVGDAAATSDDDSTIETPVSIDAAELDPAVIPSGAAALPAVLMVANWSHTSRRKRRRN